VFDIEPNEASGGASNVKFVNNTVGAWAEFFAAANGEPGSEVRDVTISGNVVARSSLLTIIITRRRENIVIAANTSLVAAEGPVFRIAHVDGLTISDNVQPLRSGSLLSIRDSSGVVTQ
jgi:hypothetical protein